MLRTAIRHPSAVDSIRAYLRCAEQARTGSHIIAYMWLMHRITSATASRTLWRLARRGEVTRLQRGLYQWGGQ